jgi:hypothetical protein
MTVKFIRNLENMFEKYIEGFFNNKFSSGLQPVEIGKQLIRKMDDERTVGVSKIYAPNLYMIYLGKTDFERITSYRQSICDELSLYVAEQAKQRQYTIIGIPIIEFYRDDSVAKGTFRIVSSFTETIPEEKNLVSEHLKCEEISDTRVFDKVECIPLKQAFLCGVLAVVEGPDVGVKIDIAKNRVNIGRRASNELPLTDLNTSRLQVYVVLEDNTHVLYDAKSLNGTYVNGNRIMRKVLETGDRIKIGNTVILYEVNSIAQ